MLLGVFFVNPAGAQDDKLIISGGVRVVEEKPEPDTIAVPVVKLQSPIFRDTMSISKLATLSLVAPGLSQVYNKDYWKVPVLYGTVGAFTYLTVNANKKYKDYKKEYNALKLEHGVWDRDILDPVQTKMIDYNTQRTVFFLGATFSYLYFLADGVIHYPHTPNTPAKRATTLAMIFPGAGQFYNKSYWKVPIVLGAFASMGYVIDFNNRGYERFKRAYSEYPNDEFQGRYPKEQFKNTRDKYRRNRDLSIILTCGLYVLSVVEAHVDAYMKSYDMTDDIAAIRVEPTMIDVSGLQASNGMPGFGLAMRFNF